LEYTLEKLTTRTIDVTLRLSGSLPISYEAGEAVLGSPSVTLTGPESLVNAVTQVVANIDLSNVTTSISRTVELRAIDSRGVIVSGVNLSPSQMPVEIPIKQMGGYRNVFVKIVTSGTIARGYYLTGLAANPPNITIYASDPEVAKNMPAFIETAPVSLNGAQISFETPAQLNLPDGITVVGDQNVVVQVSITAIESSIQLAAIPVEIINLPAGFKAEISPAVIDVYISGPLVAIEKITAADVKATLDLSQKSVGTYQLIPVITLTNPNLRIDSILPGTIEVVISR
jgi:YbbR domain-containing protein